MIIDKIWNKIKKMINYYEVEDLSTLDDFNSFDEFKEETDKIIQVLEGCDKPQKANELSIKDIEKIKIIVNFLESSILENVTFNEKDNLFTLDINGIVFEIDDRKNIHVKNINMMILDYKYGFLGDNKGKTKAELLNDAITSIRVMEKEIEEKNKLLVDKQKRELPFLDTENMIIPEYKISDTGLIEAIKTEITTCQCHKPKKKKSFWIGLNRIIVED